MAAKSKGLKHIYRAGTEKKVKKKASRKATAKRRANTFTAPCRASKSDAHVTEQVISQMPIELDGLDALKGVVAIGVTCRPDILDEALLRPGRFDRILKCRRQTQKQGRKSRRSTLQKTA